MLGWLYTVILNLTLHVKLLIADGSKEHMGTAVTPCKFVIRVKSRNVEPLLWSFIGIALGMLVGIVTSTAGISLGAGIATWCVSMALALLLPRHPIAARVSAFITGLLMVVPSFVLASPMARSLLACSMAMPFITAAVLALAPPIAGLRGRLAYLLTWCGTRRVTRRACGVNGAALRDLAASTAVLAAAFWMLNTTTASGSGWLLRWFAGGIAVFAFAEMATSGLPFVAAAFGLTVPALFQSPHRSASIGEFWTKRWNLGASVLFHTFCFSPLARRGAGLAMFITFLVSGIGHFLLALMALGKWVPSIACGAFFIVQPFFIAIERRLKVRRWKPLAGWAWTLTVLAITSPLFVEPLLELIERSGGSPGHVLLPTAAALCSVIFFSSFVSVASLAARPALTE